MAPSQDDAVYLYVIAYSDDHVTQGVLAQFRARGVGGGLGELIRSGDGGWEVCAAGDDYDIGSGGPSSQRIDDMIVNCSEFPQLTFSQGWVDEQGHSEGALAVGEDNSTPRDRVVPGNEFPLVCHDAMDADNHWMWFDWTLAAGLEDQEVAFISHPSAGDYEFLIFRFPTQRIVPPA